MADAALPASAALPSAPAAIGSAAAQQSGNYYGGGQSLRSRLAWEVGGGFNAPAGDKDYITWGGQFTLGAGYNFSRYLAMMMEYQFMSDKLPGRLIAQTGANGGYAHIWSFTLDPVFYPFPGATNSIYVTGGGGFYRKVTSFTDPEPAYFCDYYYGYCGTTIQNTVVGHFSSNQGGVNIGMGFYHRLGGMYGEGRTKLFAEIRYLDVFTPAVNGTTPNGLGVTTVGAGTKVIPVTFGIRW